MLGFLKRKNPILVSDMTTAHHRQCADIHMQSFSRGWSDGTLGEMFATGNMEGLVATRKIRSSEIVDAFLIYRKTAGECEIITIATSGEYRRNGAAKALLNEMIRRCLTDRMEQIFLEVDETNDPAVRLYRSFGFRQVGKRKAYYAGENPPHNTSENSTENLAKEARSAHDAFIMRLDLLD